jgi:hypothetical protein
MNSHLNSRIEQLAEDTYEHFLRESCRCVNEGEWYEVAFAVADRFRNLIVDSQERNEQSLTNTPQ